MGLISCYLFVEEKLLTRLINTRFILTFSVSQGEYYTEFTNITFTFSNDIAFALAFNKCELVLRVHLTKKRRNEHYYFSVLGMLRPVHTERKRTRKRKRTKNNRKSLKKKIHTSKEVFAFAFAFT